MGQTRERPANTRSRHTGDAARPHHPGRRSAPISPRARCRNEKKVTNGRVIGHRFLNSEKDIHAGKQASWIRMDDHGDRIPNVRGEDELDAGVFDRRDLKERREAWSFLYLALK